MLKRDFLCNFPLIWDGHYLIIYGYSRDENADQGEDL